jgi:hypothetical protein
MEDMSGLEVAPKRQLTLHLSGGDVIRLEVTDGQITKVEPCPAVPSQVFTPEVLERLANQNKPSAIDEDRRDG